MFSDSWETCFLHFNNSGTGLTSINFKELCKGYFEQVELNRLEETLEDIFNVFDKNKDGILDREEFEFCWKNWISVVLKPTSALIIIDVQNDFISGTLDIRNCPAEHNGEDVVKPINDLLNKVNFRKVFYSLDWHPENHISFFENKHLRKFHSSSEVNAENAKVYDTVVFEGDPPRKQVLWPKHCVQDTWGSELHTDLQISDEFVEIKKGVNPEIDSYSAFWDNAKFSKTKLEELLKNENITDVYICGIATDFCVGFTAKDSIGAGFRTILIEDCCRGVNKSNIEDIKNDIISKNGCVCNSTEVENMVAGLDRRIELAHFLALQIKNNYNL